MKKIIYTISSLTITLLLIVNFSGCVKQDFDDIEPRIDTTSLAGNTTIAELKAFYPGYLTQLTNTSFFNRDSILIEGFVTSDDKEGNFYKTIVIQDNTGAIELKLDKTYLYNDYKRGQRVVVYCNKLFLGDYYGLIQLGSSYEENNYEQLGGIEGDIMIKRHVFRKGGTLLPVEPLILQPSNLTVSNVSKLVTVKNVKFITPCFPGTETLLTFADKVGGESVDHSITGFTDSYTNLVVRTSGFASFANEKLTKSYVDITGILSYYKSSSTTYQIIIRDLKDIKIHVP